MLAKVNGVFRLTRDAELKYTQAGVAILNIGLACSEKYKDNEKQLFLDATAFGKAGELINQYAGRKGTQISLSGKLETQQWVDQSGNKRSKISMSIEDFEFLGSKNDNQQTPAGNAPQQNQQQAQSYQAPQSQNSRYDDTTKPTISMGYDGKPIQNSPISDNDSDEIPF